MENRGRISDERLDCARNESAGRNFGFLELKERFSFIVCGVQCLFSFFGGFCNGEVKYKRTDGGMHGLVGTRVTQVLFGLAQQESFSHLRSNNSRKC